MYINVYALDLNESLLNGKFLPPNLSQEEKNGQSHMNK